MPNEDTKIGRMNGRYLVLTEDGYQPLNGIQTVEITEELPALEIDGSIPTRIVKEPSKLTASVTLSDDTKEALRNLSEMAEAMMRVFGQVMKVVKKMVGTCPNRRVVHLSTHGSPRVRKKNVKRIVRYYKKHLKEEAEK